MKRRGFTLVELLVVIAIIALLLSILLPAINKARDLANRAVSGANMKNLSSALLIYAQTEDDQFPMSGDYDNSASLSSPQDVKGFEAGDVKSDDYTDNAALRFSSTSSLWLLVKDGSASTKNFINPASGDSKDDLTRSGNKIAPLRETWDFASADNLSYSVINMFHEQAGRNWSSNAKSSWVLAGDDNNAEKVDGGKLHTWNKDDTNLTSEDLKQDENSTNHNGAGQNLLGADGSVKFSRDPFEGPSGDNVYAGVASATSDILKSALPTLKSNNAPTMGPAKGSKNVVLIPVTGNDGKNLAAGSGSGGGGNPF